MAGSQLLEGAENVLLTIILGQVEPSSPSLTGSPEMDHPSTISNSPADAAGPPSWTGWSATISRSRAAGSRTPIKTASVAFLGSPATYI